MVREGEELTFDYANASGEEGSGGRGKEVGGGGRTRCLCGAERCRGWMPFNETL